MKRPLRQALQTKQWPPCQPTPTRSPFCHSVTPAPTFSTRPAISWPGIRGSFRPGNAPPLTMTSLWQTPHASTLMRIWPESGSGSSRSTSSNALLGFETCTALIIFGMASPIPAFARDCFAMHGGRRRCAGRLLGRARFPVAQGELIGCCPLERRPPSAGGGGEHGGLPGLRPGRRHDGGHRQPLVRLAPGLTGSRARAHTGAECPEWTRCSPALLLAGIVCCFAPTGVVASFSIHPKKEIQE